MARLIHIHFRMNNAEHEALKRIYVEEGYKVEAQYLRDVALNRGPEVKQKISQVYNIILEVLKRLKKIEDKIERTKR